MDIYDRADYAKTIPGVAYVDNYQYMCLNTGSGQN